MAKQIWRASVCFVDRHPSLFTAVTVILFIAVVFVTGINYGYVELINAGAVPSVHYSRVAEITLRPGVFFLYGDAFRVGGGIEVGYIRPVSVSVIGSLPMFQAIDKNDIAVGVGLDTQVKANLFLGLSHNWRFDGGEFWAVYGKLLF